MSGNTIAQDKLCKIIEEMAKAREAMNVQRDLLNDLRREARAEGLNMQAINPLVDVMGEHSHDRGARVLNDLFSYAVAAGVQLDGVVAPRSPRPELEAQASSVAMPQATQLTFVQPVRSQSSRAIAWLGSWRRGLCHVGLALAVSVGLVWLLR